MATATVTAPHFPVSTPVRAYTLESVRYEREHDREPINATVVDSGTLDSAHQIEIEGDPGTYALLGAVNEVQQVAVAATSGTFTLTYSGQTTSALAFDISAADLKTALVALSNIGANDVSVSGGPGDLTGSTPYLVTFTDTLLGTNVAAMTADSTSLAGGAHTATITTTVQGAKQAGSPLWVTFTITE